MFTVTTLVYLCFWFAMAMVALKLFMPGSSKWLWVLVGAFLVSIVGDWFLRVNSRTGNDVDFILGVAGYFFAHVGFLIYGWKFITGRKKFSLIVGAVIMVPFLIFYFVRLLPSEALQGNMALAAAVLIYLIISCMTLAVAIDIKSGAKPSWTWFYAMGVACLLASDTLIALRHFGGDWFSNRGDWYRNYMFPLFFTSYGFIAASVVVKHLLEMRDGKKG